MMAHQAVYTSNQMAKARRLSRLVPTLQTAKDKRTGITYVIVPSSDDPERTGHLTNGLHCSCEGWRRRGACSHALAVHLHDVRNDAERIEAAQRLRRENGRCRIDGCIYTAGRVSGRCDEHARALIEDLGI